MTAVLAISLLHLAVYAQAAIIVLLLGFTGFVWYQATLWVKDCERAETELDEARRTLRTFQRMSEIHALTITRMRALGR
jgi:hypothetical protein